MELSSKALEHIKHFEGLRLKAYQDPKGIWTIGVGHAGKDVYPEMTITHAEAHNLLLEDIKATVAFVNDALKHEVTQGQFDALVSFTFNVGIGNLQSSTLLRLVNAGLMDRAAEEFSRWIYAGDKVLEGLVRRREAERKLFTTVDSSVA